MTWSSISSRLSMLAVAGLCLTAGLRPAQASLVAPGGSCLQAACGAFAGVLGAQLDTTGNLPIDSPGGASLWSGNFRSAVYAGDGSGLVFVYQFANSSGSDGIHDITMINFAGFVTDIGYLAGDIDGAGAFTAGTQNFSSADRSAGSGSTVGFNYDAVPADFITAGETSYTMVIKTNAVSYGRGLSSVINGGAQNVASFAPVPEPATYGLLALGMGGLIAIARRRKLNA